MCSRKLYPEFDVFQTRNFIYAFINTFCVFLLLRISDEFKDEAYDKEHRPYLPVPSGLVTLSELKKIGLWVLLIITGLNVMINVDRFHLYLLVMLYMGLMYKEFFVHKFLESNQFLYVVSHMMIIPLVDTFASSFAWGGLKPNMIGLYWFFALSFFNGLTLELGRKIKSEENEEANSYSKRLGFVKSMNLFRLVLLITFLLSLGASIYIDVSFIHHFVFILGFIICIWFTFVFSKNRKAVNSKRFEMLSGIWAILMYLNLGTTLFF
ncbi:MAG TPA: UbiA family prenyltransferase [Bacteroidia bacterium]